MQARSRGFQSAAEYIVTSITDGYEEPRQLLPSGEPRIIKVALATGEGATSADLVPSRVAQYRKEIQQFQYALKPREVLPGEARQIFDRQEQHFRAIEKRTGDLRTTRHIVRSEQARERKTTDFNDRVSAGQEPSPAIEPEALSGVHAAQTETRSKRRTWLASFVAAIGLTGLVALFVVAVCTYPGVLGHSRRTSRNPSGSPHMARTYSPYHLPLAVSLAPNQRDPAENEARPVAANPGGSGQEISADKPDPATSADFTDGAEELSGAIADMKRGSPAELLRRIHQERAARGMNVCPIAFRDGVPVLYFSNRKGHADLGAVLGNCAAAVNEMNAAQ
jgi:hypothetical protein